MSYAFTKIFEEVTKLQGDFLELTQTDNPELQEIGRAGLAFREKLMGLELQKYLGDEE